MANANGTWPATQHWPGGRDWLDFAMCGTADGDLFFGNDRAAFEKALWFCRRCPVRVECLEFALENDHRYGIWGGITEGQRRKLHDAHNRALDGAPEQTEQKGRSTL